MGDLRKIEEEDDAHLDAVADAAPYQKPVKHFTEMWEESNRYGPGPWSDEARKMRNHVAKFFYDRMVYDGPGKKPEFDPRGNGTKIEEARREADRFIEHLYDANYWIRGQ